MPHAIGCKLSLSPARRYVCDLLQLTRRIPAVPVQRRMKLADVAAAREAAAPRPSWRAIFLKAFAHVSAVNPLLRRSYLSLPWPRLHEHDETIASVPVEWLQHGEEELAFVSLRRPEAMSLSEIDAALQAENCPGPPRLPRFALRFGLACSGRFRTRLFGTFGLSAYAGLSAAPLHPLSMFAPTLHHGPVDERGMADVCLTYDHRVLDGCDAARALSAVEQMLHERLLTELRYLETVEAA
jgi:hypothetical protein